MCYLEQTGVKGYSEPIFAVQDLSLLQLEIIAEALKALREKLLSSDNTDKQKMVIALDKLQLIISDLAN